MNQEFLKKLTDIVGESNVCVDEPINKHITFRVGGNATYYVSVPGEDELVDIIALMKEHEDIPYYIIGNGSNMLFTDAGYKGLIVEICNKFSDIDIYDCRIIAKAGAMLSKVAKMAYEEGLTGMEQLSGIPGTIGGAVAMNAGAYGSEIKDIIVSAKVLDVKNGQVKILERDELNLGYRHSIIMEENYIVIEAIFDLKRGKREDIKQEMDRCTGLRKEKQPLEYPSAGSTFKRPEGYFAGKLVQDAGLSGYTVGGAMVSQKHCGFVVNKGGATAQDILDVIAHCQREVKEKFGVELEPEVRIIQAE
ncbi:MAG: UDP-N-acetylmuramate dehydrogenase [Lachnospiraceae bacterium]|nr:UDP-N-acetylmuramate dehydrogenase [Lachnospiraceae bacterium]